ncbi:hypothetical protein AALP_AA6G136900 [Arabis alpina]|uniref:Uncharacterized protein n=1 Tax=Arabis alpina TaxID=50452 RepID=A0A087GP22_ARAAL|nr:hypothetical protein AALP_AA6G136900 [Arabis alpina]
MEAGRNLDHEIGFDFTKLLPSQWGDHFLTVTITGSKLPVVVLKAGPV